MGLIFLSQQQAEELKTKIVNNDESIFVNIRRELALKADAVTSCKKDNKNLVMYANDIVALCNAGYYLNNDCYLKAAAAKVDCLMSKSVKEFLVCTEVSSVKKVEALCKLMHSVSILALAEAYASYEDTTKKWLAPACEEFAGDCFKNIYDSSFIWVQAYKAALATWCADKQGVLDAVECYKTEIMPEIESYKLKMPNENSLTASLDILNAMTMVCEIAYLNGIDIWNYDIPGPTEGLPEFAEIMMEYMKNPYHWKYPMKNGNIPEDLFAYQYLALRLGKDKYLQANEVRRGAKYIIRDQDPIGPLALLPNSPIFKTTLLYSKMGFNVRDYSHAK